MNRTCTKRRLVHSLSILIEFIRCELNLTDRTRPSFDVKHSTTRASFHSFRSSFSSHSRTTSPIEMFRCSQEPNLREKSPNDVLLTVLVHEPLMPSSHCLATVLYESRFLPIFTFTFDKLEFPKHFQNFLKVYRNFLEQF